jgi:hypothetical protein
LAFGGSSLITGEVKHASTLPLITGALLFVLGSASIPLAFLVEQRWLFAVGYVATPVLVLMCYAWDNLAQRSGSRDPWFSLNKKATLALRIIAIASFIPAAIQVWQISIWIGEIAVQDGWFS